MVIGIDVETWPIRPGLSAPRLVCGAFAVAGASPALHDADATVRELARVLEAGAEIVTHNGAYDACVVAAYAPWLLVPILDAMEAGRWHDTYIRQRLLDLAGGTLYSHKHSLAALVARHLGIDIAADKHGADAWRLRYCELDGLDPADYPPDARRYALSDAEYTRRVYEAQGGPVPDERRQVQTAMALQLSACWGCRIDADAVAALRHRHECELARIDADLRLAGIVRENGSLDTAAVQARVADAYEGAPPLTESGSPSRAKAVLEAVAGRDPVLAQLVHRGQHQSYLTAVIPKLETGGRPLNTRYYVVKSTGRVSSSPNVQNLPRSGGFRECFVAREGCRIIACDYSTMEIRTWAQVLYDLFGDHSLARALRAGRDVHADLACRLLGIDRDQYDPESAEHRAKRQFAKVPNFGLPGGMGAASLVQYSAAFGHSISEAEAASVIELWHTQWPEADRYFRYIASLRDPGTGTIRVEQHRSGRVRAGAHYTAACNTLFQGLAADAMNDAIWRIQRECYAGAPVDPLRGCRLLLAIHDEAIVEAPAARAVQAAERVREHMEAAGRQWCPDIPIVAEPEIMTRWSK